MSVTKKLYLLVAVGVISALVISAVAIYGVFVMSRASHSIFDNAFLVNKNVTSLITLSERGGALVRGLSAERDPARVEAAAKEFDAIDQKLADTSIDVFRSITNDGVREVVSAFIQQLDDSRKIALQVFAAKTAGDDASATRLLSEDYDRSESMIRASLERLSTFVDGLAAQELSRLERTREGTVVGSVAVAILVPIVLGFGAAVYAARQIVRPLASITRAARDVERRRFTPQVLDEVSTHRSELGSLARIFTKMALEVQTREEHLEKLVQERTRDLESKNAMLEETQRRMEAELEIARALQAAMLPQRVPSHPNYAGRAIMVPARQMGGDFYDCFPIGDDKVGLVIADVSGKGVPAAFFMAISRTVLQTSARDHRAAGQCLAEANTILCEQNPLDLFVTVFYGILDLKTGVMNYANGGHNPPVIIRGGGQMVLVPPTGGVAMGVIADLTYAEGVIELEPNDTLFLYTDGISEAMNREGREFTQDRLLKSLSESHHQSVEVVISSVTNAVDAFVDGAPQSDDITCLVVRYRGPPDEERQSAPDKERQAAPDVELQPALASA